MSKRAEFYVKGQELLAKPYHYRASGLDNVYLLNGVGIEQSSYGPMMNIDDINGLHHAIGLYIVGKTEPMTGAEFRFLRNQLELTQAELGKRLRVSNQTIANYEKEKSGLGPADPFIRGFYLLNLLPEHTPIDVLKKIVIQMAARKHADLPAPTRRKLVQLWRTGRQDAA